MWKGIETRALARAGLQVRAAPFPSVGPWSNSIWSPQIYIMLDEAIGADRDRLPKVTQRCHCCTATDCLHRRRLHTGSTWS